MFDWKSQAFPGYRPVREPWMTKIVDVHWGGKLFLYVRLRLGNFRYGQGPTPVANVSPPDYTLRPHEGVTEIDKVTDLDFNEQSEDGFSTCMQYVPEQTAFVDWGPFYVIPPPEGPLGWADPIMGPVGHSAQAAYDGIRIGFGRPGGLSFPYAFRPSIEGTSCPLYFDPVYPGQYPVASMDSWNDHASRSATYYVQLAIIPVNYFSKQVRFIEYLFAIKPGDEIISLNVGNILKRQTDTPPYQEGYAGIDLAVFSTARKPLTKVEQVANLGEQGFGIDYEDQKLDPDHEYVMNLTSESQGNFLISVKKHEDPDYRQTDNYGKKFHPYRISLSPIPPTDVYYEFEPDQPPIRLPLPPGVKPEPDALPEPDAE